MSADVTKDLTFEVVKDTYIGVFKKFLVFDGRARRREFWIFALVNCILGFIPGINVIVGLVTAIPSLAVAIRRLHDTNRSGKWVLLMIVPVVGFAIVSIAGFGAVMAGSRGGLGAAMFLVVLLLLVSLGLAILFIVWAAQEGTRGDNKYGPDPKA